ncbi:secretory subunit [Binucleata daphniae]
MLYDPYKTLGLEQDASEKEIKKAFKKIVKTSDPDKIEDKVEKEKMNEYLFSVNHAYNLLRDKKKLDKFNSVTKETEEVVAIPKQIIENGWFLFVCYIAVLCVLLPSFAIKKWRQSTGCNRLGIRYDSVDTMYRKSKNDLLGKEFITGIRNIIWLLCESEEIKGIKTAKVNEWARKEIIKKCAKDISKKDVSKKEATNKLSQTNNDEQKNNDEQRNNEEQKNVNKIGDKTSTITNSSKKGNKGSTVMNNNKKITTNSNKKVTNSSVSQIPIDKKANSTLQANECTNIIDKNDEIRKFVKNHIEYNFGYPLKETKMIGYFVLMDYLFRTNIFKESEKSFVVDKCIKGVEVLKKIALAKNLKDVLESIFVVDKMLHQAVFDYEYSMLQYPGIVFEDIFMNKITQKDGINLPHIAIKNIQAYVKDTGEVKSESEDITIDNENDSIVNENVKNTKKVFKIEKESIITVKITLERDAVNKKYNVEEENSFIMKMKGENDVELLNTLGKSIKTKLHAPYLPFEKFVTWSVVFYYNNNLMKFNPVFSDFEGTKDIFFEMESEKNGSGKLKIMVKCGQYFDLDKTEEIQFDYV